ncbi:MAG: uracil phosphoribosyltransferase, partial [Oscillospiraceae bacterium]|nr:uracil phosphoribosyltransferase [Oscillospiraceae bacterium]
MGTLHVLDHPLIQHKLAILRNKETGVKEFRESIGEIAALMCYEATRNLPTKEVQVETPITTATCRVLDGKKLAIVPILRAGLGMVDPIIDLIPSAKIGHIGLFRDPDTHEPVKYYCKMPPDIAERQVFVVDPMLATGGSAIAAIDFLKKHGCKQIIMMNVIGCPEGVKAVQDA